jgi:small-conductance mechanosensitive channel
MQGDPTTYSPIPLPPKSRKQATGLVVQSFRLFNDHSGIAWGYEEGIVRCLAAAIIVGILISLGSPALADSAAPPGTLTQPQFDALAEAVSNRVIKKLEDEGFVAAKKPSARTETAAPVARQDDDVLRQEMGDFVERTRNVLAAYPMLWTYLSRFPTDLDDSSSGGRSLFHYLSLLGIAGIGTLGAELLLWLLLTPVRHRLHGALVGAVHIGYVAILAVFDFAGLLAMRLAMFAFVGAWFTGNGDQDRIAGFVLSSLFAWRMYLFVFRIFLRPESAKGRIVPIDDADAGLIYTRLSVTVFIVLVQRIMRAIIEWGASGEVLGAEVLIADVVILATLLWATYTSRNAITAWFTELAATPKGRGGLKMMLARHWMAIVIPFFIVLIGASAFGAITDRRPVPLALILSLNVIIGLLLFETLLHHLRRQFSPVGDPIGVGSRPRLFDVLARSLRVAILIAAALTVAQAWIVDVLGLVDSDQWQSIIRSGLSVGLTVFAAYVAVEFVHFFAARYAIASPSTAPAAVGDPEESTSPATRLATLVPLMKFALLAVIIVVATLIVLSYLGVNITPLIAGASVFGLAISFGSQTLVRDIVSGVFYLADDAFRVGEYIDCGKAKGTVEGFTMRSLRLRHQNGPVHTIPFGQLGQITNFSRDWTTMKFNLRFARNTDLEKLRKAVKKIGLEMMEDPEFKSELIQPLKMMGVADITDNALVIRFKFTARPSNPSAAQRNAIKRMFSVFPAAGIEFANATIAVQSVAGQPDVHAGAAASAALNGLRSSSEAAQ